VSLLSCYLAILLSCYLTMLWPPHYQVHLQEQRVLLRRTLWSGVGRHPEHGAQHDVWHVRTLNCHIILDLSHAEALTLCIAFAVGAKCASFATTRTIDN
jgi:hypothetical protein